MLEWIEQHRTSLYWMGGGTLLFFIVMMVATPILIVHMPADFLQRNGGGGVKGQGKGGQGSGKGGGMAWKVGRNILGWVLIAAGVAMMVLPGPGVLVLIIGVTLADFPGKQKALRWLVSRKSILKPANRLRERFGKPPLQVDSAASDTVAA